MRVFLRPRGFASVAPGSELRLGQVAEVIGGDRLSELPLGPGPAAGRYRVLALTELVRAVSAAAPDADIRVLGVDDVVVRGRRPPRAWAWLLAAVAWLLLFVGATVTILNFHADVNMPAVHREIYRLLTGRVSAHPLLLEIPYAVGVGVGVAVFLRPWRGEPGPLELEAARYERGLHAYLRDRP